MLDDREMYKEVQATVGAKPAKILLILGLVAFGCTSVGAIGLFLYYASTRVVQPAMALIPALPSGSVQVAVISFGVSISIVGIVAFVAYQRWQLWDRVLTNAIDSFVKAQVQSVHERIDGTAGLDSVKAHDAWIEGRLDKLETHAASVHTVKHYCQSLEKEIKELQAHTTLPPKGPPQTLGELMGAGRGIGNVGQIVEKVVPPRQ